MNLTRHAGQPTGARRALRLPHTLRRILLSYLCVFLLPMLVLYAATWYYLDTWQSAQIDHLVNVQLGDVYNDVKTLFSGYTSLMEQLLQDQDIQGGYDPRRYSEGNEIQQKLLVYTQAHSSLKDIWVYYDNARPLISGTSSSQPDRFFGKTIVLEDASIENFDDLMSRIGNTPSAFVAFAQRKFLFLCRRMPLKKEYVVLLQIDLLHVDRMVEPLMKVWQGTLTLSYDGKPICEAQSAVLPTSGQWITRTASASDMPLTLELRACMPEKSRYFINTFIVVNLIALVGLAATILAARSQYKPLKTLRDSVSRLSPLTADGADTGDDFEFIQSCLDTARLEKTACTNQLTAYKRAISEYVTFTLLRGKYARIEDLLSDAALLDIRVTDGCWGVYCVLSEGFEVYERVCALFLGIFGEGMLLERAPEDGRLYVAVVSLPDEAAHERALQRVSEAMERELPNTRAAFGGACASCAELPWGYARALLALNLRGLGSDPRVTRHHPFDAPCMGELQPLLNALREARLDEAYSLIPDFDALRIDSCEEAFSTCCALLDALVESAPALSPDAFDRLHALLLIPRSDPTHLDQVLSLLRQILRPAAPARDDDDAPALIDRMKRFVSERYDDPDFSLKYMGEEFSMSVSALSTYFKRKTGAALSEYVADIKMEKAKNLLAETAMSINDVGMAVGYYNCTSFVRRFKQLTGQTPGEYRKAAANP